jgi:calcium binding protein 39
MEGGATDCVTSDTSIDTKHFSMSSLPVLADGGDNTTGSATTASGSTSQASHIPSPFEWLSGGLFFGRSQSSRRSASESITSSDAESNGANDLFAIETSTDVVALIEGMVNDMKVPETIVATKTSSVGNLSGAGSSFTSSVHNSTATATSEGEGEDEGESVRSSVNASESKDESLPPTPADYFAARSARLRFLLYEERRRTSQQQQQQQHGTVTLIASPSRAAAVPPVAWTTVQCLVLENQHPNFLLDALSHLEQLPFESRKHLASIFNYLLVAGLDGTDAHFYQSVTIAFRNYILERFQLFMDILILQGHCTTVATIDSGSLSDVSSYTPPPSDVALHSGSMLRACLRHLQLYQALVETTATVQRYIYPFLDIYVHYPNFDVASDAMETLRNIFTVPNVEICIDSSDETESHSSLPSASQITAHFLLRDYDEIWIERFNKKLLSPTPASAVEATKLPASTISVGANYMTRRVALQILSTVLLTRSNYNIMIKYVASRSNLILVMQLLRDPSPHITLDAFHVFKVFVANPQKPDEVIRVLRDNKTKLVNYLTTLHQDKEQTDPQFRDEKTLIIATIDAL